ncbi:MAG: hypothetical protein NTY35_08790 [Planctomycetota bacterium]|nr:hypothetical protein [Planctomycetota bacterium]
MTMDITTILVLAILSLAPQTTTGKPKDAAPSKTEGDDFFVGRKGTLAPQDAAGWKRQIARARLALEVDGRADLAVAQLSELIERLVDAPGFEGRDDVVLELLEVGLMAGEKLGDPRVADELLTPTHARPDHAKAKAWEALLQPLVTNPRFVVFQQRMKRQSGAAPGDATRIEQLVRQAVRDGSQNLAKTLGAAAGPALEALVREEPDLLPNPQNDALYMLMQCAPQRAAALSLELLRGPGTGFLFAKRVLRALGGAQTPALRGDSTAWRFEERNTWKERPPVLIEPVWRDLVAALLAEPIVGQEALEHAQYLVDFDALDEPSRRALADLARSGEAGAAGGVARILDAGGLRESVRPLLEALLQAPSNELRIVAASELAREARNAALLARVEDPEPLVRAAIARSLEVGKLEKVLYNSPSFTFNDSGQTRQFLAGDRPLLDRLLGDGDAGVRAAALKSATSAQIRLEPERAARLLADPDAVVRRAVVSLLPASPAAVAPLLERALADANGKVRETAVTELYARFGIQNRGGSLTSEPPAVDPTPALLPLALQQLIPGPEDAGKENRRWNLVRVLVADPDDARAFVRAFLAAPVVPSISARDLTQSLSGNGANVPGSWRHLDADLVRALLLRADKEAFELEQVARSLSESERPPAVRAGIAVVVRDPSVERRFRVALLPALREEPDLGRWIAQVLTEPAFGAEASGRDLLQPIQDLPKREVPTDAIRAALPAVFAARVPDDVVLCLVSGLVQAGQGPAEHSQKILERFASANGGEAVNVVNWAVSREADQGRWASVRAALSSPRSRQSAIQALGRGRPAEGLAWLGALLHDPAESRKDGARIAEAIAGYLSEEAAEILLRGAELAPSADVRKACLEGVAEIRAFLDQKAGWQQRASGAKQRDAAVVELAAMLDAKDPVQRAEAARGLATLDGVEHLPRLVRMLQDPDGNVRKAVQESLERLNRPK